MDLALEITFMFVSLFLGIGIGYIVQHLKMNSGKLYIIDDSDQSQMPSVCAEFDIPVEEMYDKQSVTMEVVHIDTRKKHRLK